MKYIALILVVFIYSTWEMPAQRNSQAAVKLARVKYSGGGDWYNDPSSEANLLRYVSTNTNIMTNPIFEFVDLSSDNLFAYPLIFLTGHGNVTFSNQEARRLRHYLENGGFLYIDDDYGLDEYIRKEMQKVFPDKEFVELPYSHGIYHSHFSFPQGTPKVHEHDNKPPQTFGIFHEGRLCVVYTIESNPADAWADADIHNTPANLREKALQFGTNIIVWAINN